MAHRDERLAKLALALSDGTPVDWDAAESNAATDSERRQIRELRAIRRLTGPSASDSSPAAPESWGPLRLIERIGGGRFGDVYRAWDRRLAREVALKLLRRENPSDQGDVIEEGRVLAKIRHPNVVTVFGAERIDGRVGVWMELVRGETLAAALTRGPMPWSEATAIVADVARALAAVHEAGLLHRDVKAQNVVREAGGRVVLMDFGTSRDMTTAARAELAGTPLYLPPEVLDGAPAAVSADIYRAGVLLFHLLTGTYPVPGRSVAEVRAGHRRGDVGAALAELTTVPNDVVRIIQRALATDPAHRFSSAANLSLALNQALEQPPSGAADARGSRSLRRRPLALIASLLLIVVLGVNLLRRGTNEALPAVACDDCGVLGLPSFTADGQRMAFIDASSLDAVIMDATGRKTVLELFRPAASPAAPIPIWRPVISRDGERLAVAVLRSDLVELDVASASAPSVLTPLLTDETAGVFPMDWSADGHRILVFIPDSVDNLAGTFEWMAASGGGNRTPLMRVENVSRPPTAKVSPDGRWIAYSVPPLPRAGLPGPTAVIRIMSADSGIPTRVTSSDALETDPVWSHDGSSLLFVSNVTGVSALWSVGVLDGRPSGEPQLLRSDVGASVPVATTADNRILMFESQDGVPDTTIADLAAEPWRASKTVVGSRPAWAPDGQSLALVRPAGAGAAAIAIVPMGNGVERVYRPPGLGTDRPLWFGDGQALLVRVVQDEVGYWSRLDLVTKDLEPLLRNRGNPEFVTHWGIRALAPDGRTLYFGTYAAARPGAAISRVSAANLSNGRYDDVLTLPGSEATWPRTAGHLALAVSPDSSTLAMQIVDPTTELATLWSVGVDGSNLQQLSAPFPAPAVLPGLAWIDEGRALVFAAPGSGLERTGVASFRLMRLDAAGIPEFTGFETPGWTSAFSLNPAGTVVAFDEVPTRGERQSVWSMAWPEAR